MGHHGRIRCKNCKKREMTDQEGLTPAEQDWIKKIAEVLVAIYKQGELNGKKGGVVSKEYFVERITSIYSATNEVFLKLAEERGYKSPEECLACANEWADGVEKSVNEQLNSGR